MKICLMLEILSWIPPHNNTLYDRAYAPASTLYSQKMIFLDHGLLYAVNSLQL